MRHFLHDFYAIVAHVAHLEYPPAVWSSQWRRRMMVWPRLRRMKNQIQ